MAEERDRYAAVLAQLLGGDAARIVAPAAGDDGAPAGTAASRAGDEQVAVWRAPRDPLLPGLERALDRGYATRLLSDAGVRAQSARIVLRAYPPGRRAVVELWPVVPEQRKLV